jgi:hypothetical protein
VHTGESGIIDGVVAGLIPLPRKDLYPPLWGRSGDDQDHEFV